MARIYQETPDIGLCTGMDPVNSCLGDVKLKTQGHTDVKQSTDMEKLSLNVDCMCWVSVVKPFFSIS